MPCQVVVLLGLILLHLANANIYLTHLWHLQQPIYWPDYRVLNTTSTHPTYQRAWDSIQLKSKQGGHPENNLGNIFGKPDRVAIYQHRAVDSLNTVKDVPTYGVQITYPGDLIDNINSLADADQMGYHAGWNSTYASALHNMRTPDGKPRLDIVWFAYHHAFGPLVPQNMLKKELQIQAVQFHKTWGPTAPLSEGIFPAEMAFSERMIPTLVSMGIKWVVVPNDHLSRACANYAFSQHGDNNTPPNKADQVNPKQSHWFKESVSRGCTPNNAVPFSYKPHWARHVDPATGKETKIIVVPSAMAMSWKDGYSCYNTNDMATINKMAPDEDMLVVLAHDGDNAFGGGYTYYLQCVPDLVHDAVKQGFHGTTISSFLETHQPAADDIVHVEDGAWINHDSDFGDPQFIWGWQGIPMLKNGTFSVPHGWECHVRQWAVITASENWVETAEQVTPGGLNINEVQFPTAAAKPADVAWHFHLVQPSGWLYYGCPNLDNGDKPSLAANHATHWAKVAIDGAPKVTADKTAPTIFTLQRHPYNPGGYGNGAIWHYKLTPQPSTVYIWTLIYDLSGVSEVTLHTRNDSSGIMTNENYVFGDRAAWKTYPMYKNPVTPGNTHGVKFNIIPKYIADIYWAELPNLANHTLMDYFVTAKDKKGNVATSDIYHVFIGPSDPFPTPPPPSPPSPPPPPPSPPPPPPAPTPPTPPPPPGNCNVPPPQRINCGYMGITQQECIDKGCCWGPVNPNPHNYPWCFNRTQ